MRQLDHLGLLRIEREAQPVADLPHLAQGGSSLSLLREDQIAVVVVPGVVADAHAVLDFVVQLSCGKEGEDLTDLTAEPQSDRPEHVNEVPQQGQEPRVRDLRRELLFHQPVVDVVEEVPEVKEENIALHAVGAEMGLKVMLKPPHGEVVAFVGQAGAVVVDQGAPDDGYQAIVAQAALHNPLSDDR